MIRGSRSVLDGSNIGQPGGEGTREYGSGKWLGWMMRDAAGRIPVATPLLWEGCVTPGGPSVWRWHRRPMLGRGMPITVWRSNRTEALAEELARQLAVAPPAPFVRPIVVVHGRGVATWLEQFLAQRLGVCAQIEFLFPGKFVARLFGVQAAIEGRDAPRLQQREQWFWTALGVLDELESAGSDDLPSAVARCRCRRVAQ